MNFLQQRNHENMASSVSSHNYSRRETPGHILVEKPINVFSGNMICGSQERWIKHYSSEHSILLVGDGDFSFSLCLGMAFASATNIIATSLDSYDVLINKYKNAKANMDFLKSLGATVLLGVDATQMMNLLLLSFKKFHRIIYNFPHAGFYGKEENPDMITMHKDLVRGFLSNASRMLLLDGEIHINHKTKAPFDRWGIEDLGLECQLICTGKDEFKIEDYPGYCNKRGSGSRSDEPFPLGACSTFKFKLRNCLFLDNQVKRRKLDVILLPSPQMIPTPPVNPSTVYDVNVSRRNLDVMLPSPQMIPTPPVTPSPIYDVNLSRALDSNASESLRRRGVRVVKTLVRTTTYDAYHCVEESVRARVRYINGCVERRAPTRLIGITRFSPYGHF